MRKKTTIGVALGVAIIAVITVFLAVGPEGPVERGKAPLQITINSWIGWAPLYLAKEKGLNDGAEVEIIRVEDTGARKSTMISGEVDGYASSVDNFALDAAQGVPGKIVLCFDESYGGDGIVAKKTIKTLADLKGKKIGYQKGLPAHFLLLSALKKENLSGADVEHIDMDADKAGAAFVAGHIDAAVTWEPWISKAAETADGKILVTTKDFPGLIVDVLVFRNEIISGRKEDVAKIVQGWFRALDYWKQNEDEANRIMAKAYGLEVDEFKDMRSGVRFYDQERNVAYMGSGPTSEIYSVFRSAGELWLSAGVISHVVKPEDRIDDSFIPQK